MRKLSRLCGAVALTAACFLPGIAQAHASTMTLSQPIGVSYRTLRVMPKAVPLAAIDDSAVYGAYGISLLAAAGAGAAVVVSSRSTRKRQQEADEQRQIAERRRADELQRIDQARKQLATCMGAVQTLVSARRQNAEADVMDKVGEAHQAIAGLRVGNVLDSLPSWRRHLAELERSMDEVVNVPVTRSRRALVDFNSAASVLIDQLDTWQAGRTAA